MKRDSDDKVLTPNQRVPALGEIGLNQFAPYMLNRLVSHWNDELQQMLKGLGLTVTNFRALAVLMVSPGITVNDLSTFAVTEQSTMSRSLDALEKNGMVERKPRSSDMRIRDVYITNEGVTAFMAIWPNVYRLYMRVFAGIGEDELRSFNLTLSKIVGNLERSGPPAES